MFRCATHSATDQRAGSERLLHCSSGTARTRSWSRACALRYSSDTSWSCGCMSLFHLLCRPCRPFAAPPLVHPSLQASQSPDRGSIARHFLQCAPVLRHRVEHLAFLLINARQVHVRELRRLVARRVHRLLEPRNRVVLPPQLDEIAPDVVIGIPERGIHRDRALAFGDRLVIASLERVHPAEKRDRKSTRLNSSHGYISY